MRCDNYNHGKIRSRSFALKLVGFLVPDHRGAGICHRAQHCTQEDKHWDMLRALLVLLATQEGAGVLQLRQTIKYRGVVTPTPPSGFEWADSNMQASAQSEKIQFKLPATLPMKANTNTPEAVGVFKDIGRDVGIATRDYCVVAASVAAAYWSMLAQRTEAHAPEAVGVFKDIGRGVGIATRDYCVVAASVAAAYWSVLAQRTKAHAPGGRVAQQVESTEDEIAEGATSLSFESRAATLKLEGAMAIARRSERMVALRIHNLKRQGQFIVARRAMVAAVCAENTTGHEAELTGADDALCSAAEASPPDGFKWGLSV